MTESSSVAMGGGQVESDFSPRKIKIAMVCLFGTLFATSLLPFSAFGLVLLPMTNEFGWSRTDYSYGITALMWCGALTVPILGRITDRSGVRPVILIGTLIVGLVTLAMGLQTSNVWQFYIYYALLGIFGSSGVAYSKVIATLFTRHRGKALAIFGVESTVAMSTIPMITNTLLNHFGWRGVYFAFGAIILALVPVLYFLLEEPVAPMSKGGSAAPALQGMTAGQAVRDRVFWLVVLASIAGAAPGAGLVAHIIPAIVDRGFTQDTAAAIMSSATLIGIVGTLLGGYFVDRVQTAKVNVPFSLATAVGIALLMVVTPAFGGIVLLTLALSLNSLAISAARPMGTYFHTRFFGLKAFTEIYGIQSALLALSMGFMPPIFGAIYDSTHSYSLAFSLTIGGLVLTSVIYLFLGPYRYAIDPTAEAPAPVAADSPIALASEV